MMCIAELLYLYLETLKNQAYASGWYEVFLPLKGIMYSFNEIRKNSFPHKSGFSVLASCDIFNRTSLIFTFLFNFV